MTQLNPPVTTAGQTLNKVYRKVQMPSKSAAQHRLMEAAAHGRSKKVPRGVAKEFLKADSRGEDLQNTRNVPEGNQASSSPTRRHDIPPSKGSTPAPNFVGPEQERRHGLNENGPAGKPTAEAGGIGRRGGSPTERGVPSIQRSKAQMGKARTAGSAIDEAIDDGAADFNAQVKHRSKMIRDGRRRSNERHK